MKIEMKLLLAAIQKIPPPAKTLQGAKPLPTADLGPEVRCE
jgi:hypothetical protein